MEVLKELDKTNYTFIHSTPLSVAIKMKEEDIRRCVYTITVDYQTLTDYFDDFLKIIKILKEEGTTVINCESYECIKYLNQNYKDRFPMIINVLDDYQNKDRSDINLKELDKTIITVPIAHIMWGIDFDKLVYINSVTVDKNAIYYNGNKELSLEDLKKIKEVVETLKEENLTEAQKLLVVAAYLQRNVQYVDNTPSIEIDGITYTLDDTSLTSEILDQEVGLVETVINKHYGLCMGISNAATILLNNPQMNIDARTIVNKSHAWNIVKIDGKYYYSDNTWAITRNPNQVENAILSSSFNSEFLLFGQRDIEAMKGHSHILSTNPNLKNVSYGNYRLEKVIKKSKQLVSGHYSKKPVLSMHKEV